MAGLKSITDLPMAENTSGVNLIVNDNGAAKQIAANAVGAQANWEQNDETAADYVKNRPFYTEDPKEYPLISPQITLSFAATDEEISWIDIDTANFIFEENCEYIVTFDDVTYNLKMQYVNIYGEESYWLGNPHIFWTDNEDYLDNGIPFAIIANWGMIAVLSNNIGEHTITVSCVHSKIHKIESKYIDSQTISLSSSETGEVTSPKNITLRCGNFNPSIPLTLQYDEEYNEVYIWSSVSGLRIPRVWQIMYNSRPSTFSINQTKQLFTRTVECDEAFQTLWQESEAYVLFDCVGIKIMLTNTYRPSNSSYRQTFSQIMWFENQLLNIEIIMQRDSHNSETCNITGNVYRLM